MTRHILARKVPFLNCSESFLSCLEKPTLLPLVFLIHVVDYKWATWHMTFHKIMYKLILFLEFSPLQLLLVAQTERWLSANHGLSLSSLTNDRYASWYGPAFSFHDAPPAGSLSSPCLHGRIIAAPWVVRVQDCWWENVLLQQPNTGVHLGEAPGPGGER